MQEVQSISSEFQVTVEPKEDFYPTYENWCAIREFPCIPLRQIDTVFVCFKNSVAVYSCFFWNTNSTFGVTGFPFSNPHVPYEEKKGGLTYMFDKISLTAKRGGYEILWTTSDTPRVIESMLENGFKVADTKVDQYYKRLF
jgi:hypothetical protein